MNWTLELIELIPNLDCDKKGAGKYLRYASTFGRNKDIGKWNQSSD